MTTPRSLTLALTVMALAAPLAACGEKQDAIGPDGTVEFELMLDFFPNADHAGIYAAQAKGRFRQAGLDVKIRQPADPAAPIKQVAAGRVDLAVSYTPEVLRARDEGLAVVAVAALVRKPLSSIISLPQAGIRSPRDLAGKTVGTAGIDYQSAYLRTILEQAGVDPGRVKERNVGFALSPALLTKRVDATLGGFWNYEGVDLRLRGRDPRVIRVDDAGVPSYDELVIVANEDALKRDGARIRSFVAALARGTQDLRKSPRDAVSGLLDANEDLEPELQRAAVKQTLPLFLPARGKPFGHLDGERWQRFTAWMNDNELLENTPDASGAFTNDYLPGGGL